MLGGVDMCTKSRLAEITKDVVKTAAEIFGSRLSSVILYGSYARGDYDDESDIDIMIIADISTSEISKYSKMLTSYSVDVDLRENVVLSLMLQDKSTFDKYKNTYPFYRNVEAEGVELIA